MEKTDSMKKAAVDNAQAGISVIRARIISAASLLSGSLSLMALILFLYTGSLTLVDLGLDEMYLLAFDGGLSMIFFIQHSCMTRNGFRIWMEKYISPVFHGAVFSIASGTMLILLMLFWQKSGYTFASPHWIVARICDIIFFLCIAGFLWGSRSLVFFDPYGTGNIRLHLRGKIPKPAPFSVKGPYRYVRHPLYAFFIVMMWCNPHITPDRVLFNVLWTIWIVTGSYLEERDLVSVYGDDYSNYQKRIPMLIPFTKFTRGKD